MELIATKSFKIGNRRITKGERFTCDNALGLVYVTIKNAEHPPRVLTPPPAPDPEPARTPAYQTRVMTADVVAPIVPRRRGRPRKVVPE